MICFEIAHLVNEYFKLFQTYLGHFKYNFLIAT